MKTIETKGGQIFEVMTLKEVKEQINNEAATMDDDDYTAFIEYADGSTYYNSGSLTEGKLKKSGIVTAIFSNPCTTQVYGEYKIYNMDNTEEEYSTEVDSEEKMWNVEER